MQDRDGCSNEIPAEVAAFVGVIQGLGFAGASTKLDKRAIKVLDRLARTMRDHSSMRIEIVVHTDDQAGRDAALESSQLQADAVRKHLIAAGVEAERVSARGAGPDAPIADNGSKQGRAANRRVELRLVGS